MRIKIHCDDGYETILQAPNDILFEQIVEEVCNLRRAHGYDLSGQVVPSPKRNYSVAYQLHRNQARKGANSSSTLDYSNPENVSLKLPLNGVSGFQNAKLAEIVVYIYGFKSQEQINMLQQLYQFSSKLTLANMSFARALDKYAHAFPSVSEGESLLMITDKSFKETASIHSEMTESSSKRTILQSVSDRLVLMFDEIRNVFEDALTRVDNDPITQRTLMQAKNLFVSGDLAGAMSVLQFPSSHSPQPEANKTIGKDLSTKLITSSVSSSAFEPKATNLNLPKQASNSTKLSINGGESVLNEKLAATANKTSTTTTTTKSNIITNTDKNSAEPVLAAKLVSSATMPVTSATLKTDPLPTRKLSETSTAKVSAVAKVVKSNSSSSSSSSGSGSSSSSSSGESESESDSESDDASKGTQVTSTSSSSHSSRKSSGTLHSEPEQPPLQESRPAVHSLQSHPIKSLKDIAEMETQKLLSSQDDIIDTIFEPLTSPSKQGKSTKVEVAPTSSETKKFIIPLDLRPKKNDSPLLVESILPQYSPVKAETVPPKALVEKPVLPVDKKQVIQQVKAVTRQEESDSDSDSEASSSSSASSKSSSSGSGKSKSGDDSRSDSEDDSSSSSSSGSDDDDDDNDKVPMDVETSASKKNQTLALTNQTSVKKPVMDTSKPVQSAVTPSALKSLLGAGTPMAGRPSLGPSIIPVSTTKSTPSMDKASKASVVKDASDSDTESSSSSSESENEAEKNDDKDDDIGDLPKFPVMKDQVLPSHGRQLRSNSKTDDAKIMAEVTKAQKSIQQSQKEPASKKLADTRASSGAAAKKAVTGKAAPAKKEKGKNIPAGPSLRSLIGATDASEAMSDKEEEMVYFTKSPVPPSPLASPIAKKGQGKKRTAASAGLPDNGSVDKSAVGANKGGKAKATAAVKASGKEPAAPIKGAGNKRTKTTK